MSLMFARKYRPQTISTLDSQHIRETLGKALLDNKWAQSYLLTGPRGTGKTTTARLIAKIVNCTKRKTGDEPCNKCDSCVAITNGTSLDVIEIDAASNRGIDEIRDLREKVKLAPSSSRYKVYIIDEVHMLTAEAFNALLKTLEEPPEHVIFVLATTDLSKVPQTIVSRCQHYEFGLSTLSETVKSLDKVVKEEKLDVEDGVLLEIAKSASGSFRDAHKILEQVSVLDDKITGRLVQSVVQRATHDELIKLLRSLDMNRKKDVLEIVENLVADGKKPKELTSELISLLKDQLLNQAGIKTGIGDILGWQSEKIIRLINLLLESLSFLRETPVPQLPLEIALCEFLESGSSTSLIETTNKLPFTNPEPKPVFEPELPPSHANIESVSDQEILSKWADVSAATKPYNHSLTAFLKATAPQMVDGNILSVQVFYKFHKDKLEEKKNRDIIEKVLSDIMHKDLKVKFVLGEKK